MSEPIPHRLIGEQANTPPFLIEMPVNPVGIKMIPHHLATAEGALVRTGKIEVRFENPITNKNAKRTVNWQATAYNVAQQAAYHRQVYDNAQARAEEYERKYSNALINYDQLKLDQDRLRPVVNAAFHLRTHWAFFLLPKSFQRLVSAT